MGCCHPVLIPSLQILTQEACNRITATSQPQVRRGQPLHDTSFASGILPSSVASWAPLTRANSSKCPSVSSEVFLTYLGKVSTPSASDHNSKLMGLDALRLASALTAVATSGCRPA